MAADLYNTDILSLSSTLRNESLDAPDGTARLVSKLCGSWVEIDIRMDEGQVGDAALRVQACALGQASAALLKENIVGASLKELIAARDALKAMLRENGDPPLGRYSRLSLLEGVRNYPARHQSTLLAFDAAVKAVQSAQAKTT